MGKRNRLKHLIGRFNKETQSEIIPLPYSINNVVREMHVKMDLNHDTSLAIANVPYYLKEDLLKELCTKALGMNVARVHFTISTSLHGDLKTGYRSGFLNFMTMQDRRCAFDACKVLEKPIDLDDVELKVPKWHKIMSLKRSHSAINDSKTEEHEKADLIKPDDDHWVNVTKQHKSSFRGKINRIVPLNANMEKADTRIGDDKMDADVDEAPARKKRK